MKSAEAKSRSWCNECEAWHPRDEHIVRAATPRGFELRAGPRPSPPAARRSAWLRVAVFVCLILPAGAIAWSAAAYVMLWFWPQIRAAVQ